MCMNLEQKIYGDGGRGGGELFLWLDVLVHRDL